MRANIMLERFLFGLVYFVCKRTALTSWKPDEWVNPDYVRHSVPPHDTLKFSPQVGDDVEVTRATVVRPSRIGVRALKQAILRFFVSRVLGLLRCCWCVLPKAMAKSHEAEPFSWWRAR